METVKLVGQIAAVVLPFWNIPLILRIYKRKSADDISLAWLVGVWVCVIAMLPSAIVSEDRAFKLLGIVNAFFFTCVFITVLKYHPICRFGKSNPPK